MYALLGFESSIVSMEMALANFGMKTKDNNISSIKFLYNRWLASEYDAAITTLSSVPELVFLEEDEKTLLTCFVEDGDKDDCLDAITPSVITQTIATRNLEHITHCLGSVEIAREELHELCEDWGILFDLYINRVFCADIPKNAGGSSARAIGVMWVNLPRHTELADFVEFCIHELTHHMIFVDQQAFCHYREDGYGYQARSAIRGALRPLPAAFDSLLVALEILYFRMYVSPVNYSPIIHPDTEKLCEGIEQSLLSILSLHQKQAVLSERGWYLFQEAMSLYQSIVEQAENSECI